MKPLILKALVVTSTICLSVPAAALCVMMPPEDFAALDFGTAERFDQGEALMLMAGMMGMDDVASVPPGTITLWALVAGDQVFIIRQTGPTTLCSDEPLPRSTFETGKLRGLPRSG